jgi:BlaI family transcriptional regulator, penicillinase repressor
MGRPAQDITESELAVLRILWDRGTATIRQLTNVLYPQGEAAQYATVQKLLDRMEAKGYVRRDRTMFVHIFRSVFDRDELIGRRLRSLAEMLCDGSLTPLLTHLARAKDLSDADRLALRAIVHEPDLDSDTPEVDHGTDAVVRTLGESPQAPQSRSSANGQGNVGQ